MSDATHEGSHKDFFISYNSRDKEWAEWVAYQLEEANYTLIIQAWDFLAGDLFVREMHQASIECKRTIAIISPNYFDSRFTYAEWAAAFAQDPLGEHGILLPVRVEKFDPPGLLKAIAYIDLVKLDRDEARKKLLQGVRRERRKPKEEPPFPGTAKP